VGGIENNGDDRMNIKRPNKYPAYDSKTKTETPYYLCSDIDPLLEELENHRMQKGTDVIELMEDFCKWLPTDPSRWAHLDASVLVKEFIMSRDVKVYNSKPTGTKPFPTLEEFRTWLCFKYRRYNAIYEYFSQFRYEKMPEVGKAYEFSHDGVTWVNFKLKSFNGEFFLIRPIQTPSREEVIEKARQVLSEDEIAILTGGNQ
jgi:hypothetical protein